MNQYLKEIRSVDIQHDSLRFRRNIERIGEVMAVEVSRELTYAPEQVQTPLGVAEVQVPTDKVVLATVYNNLNKLQKEELIRRVSTEGMPDRYDRVEKHNHLVCRCCGKLTDISLKGLSAPLREQLGDSEGTFE